MSAIEDMLMLTGVEVAPGALDAMAEASAGYPFMIQLMGCQT